LCLLARDNAASPQVLFSPLGRSFPPLHHSCKNLETNRRSFLTPQTSVKHVRSPHHAFCATPVPSHLKSKCGRPAPTLETHNRSLALSSFVGARSYLPPRVLPPFPLSYSVFSLKHTVDVKPQSSHLFTTAAMVAFRVSAAATLAARSAAVAATALQARNSQPEPTIQDALSGIFGSVSLTAWICLLVGGLGSTKAGRLAA
jgi:hypothetical protein